MSFTGVILCGGASRRMGEDKAFTTVPTPAHPAGTPLVTVARDALIGAGASQLMAAGGDRVRLAALGLTVHPDAVADAGPLAGLLTGLDAAREPVVVVLTCDVPAITASVVTQLVDALAADPSALAAMPVRDGRRQILTAAYRRTIRSQLRTCFDAGERSVRRALDSTAAAVTIVPAIDPATLVDLDDREAVRQYARGVRREAPGPTATRQKEA